MLYSFFPWSFALISSPRVFDCLKRVDGGIIGITPPPSIHFDWPGVVMTLSFPILTPWQMLEGMNSWVASDLSNPSNAEKLECIFSQEHILGNQSSHTSKIADLC